MDDVVVDGAGPAVRDRKRAECYQPWLELARDDDFVGVQNYERIVYDGEGQVAPPEGAELNQMGSVIDPRSLAGAVTYAHTISGVPVLVTEHGMSTADDRQRAAFIEPSLAGLLDAMEDGVPVLGYCHWTLVDNFEWIFGYGHQLGLHELDRETYARTPKPSARVYAGIARAHALGSGAPG
jgi:beta-glucosidase